MASISLRSVTKHFGGERSALSEINLEFADGRFVVLVGPSGCGKSTLLRLIAGFERPTSGSIRIGDQDVTRVRPQNRDVAMVFQSYALYPHMTVRQNLQFGLRRRREPRTQIETKTTEVATALGLSELLDRLPDTLSGGQRQRVAIGRAMVREPSVYLMDEPLSNLDAKLRVTMRSELAQLHARLGVTTVYVTHDQTEAMTLGDDVCVLDGGVVQQVGTPRELYERPRNRFVAGFIGSPAMNFMTAEIVDGLLVHGALRIPVDTRVARAIGDRRRVELGIRPDDLSLVTASTPLQATRLKVVPEMLEYLGTDQSIEFSWGASEDRCKALIDPLATVALGVPVDLAVDPSRIHLFDPDDGVALGIDERPVVDSRISNER